MALNLQNFFAAVAPHAFFAESTLAYPVAGRAETLDSLEQLAQADAADRTLLRLVLCAAAATLLLALASSLAS